MSGMEVTKRTLLSTNRVCGPVAPAPIGPGYTQHAGDTALRPARSAGPAPRARPVRAFDGHPAARISAPALPPADAAAIRHMLLAVIATVAPPCHGADPVPQWREGRGKAQGHPAREGHHPRPHPAGFSPAAP